MSVVDFVDSGKELEPVEAPSLTEQLARQSGSLISAGTILVVAILFIWFGLRPATKALLATKPGNADPIAFLPDGPPVMGDFASVVENFNLDSAPGGLLSEPSEGDDVLRSILARKGKNNPQKLLEQLVDYDEGQAAAILKQWIRQGEHA